jgi:hypothetical protein
VDGLTRGLRQPDAARGDRHGEDLHHGPGHRPRAQARRSSWPTTRRSPPSCTPSSASSSRTTRSSTSSATSTTTSRRRTCPRSDTYIEKDSSRNEEIDKLRHAATHALFERRDVIIVASVSCIYGLGAPVDYGATVLQAPRRAGSTGATRPAAPGRPPVPAQRRGLAAARFRVRGDTLELQPASEDRSRPRRVLRRRGRADHGDRSADRRAARRARELNVYPGDALRDAPGQAGSGDRRHRGGDGGARRLSSRRRAGRWRPRACASGRRSTWR